MYIIYKIYIKCSTLPAILSTEIETYQRVKYSLFHIKGTLSVHSFNGDYLLHTGSWGYLFHEIPYIRDISLFLWGTCLKNKCWNTFQYEKCLVCPSLGKVLVKSEFPNTCFQKAYNFLSTKSTFHIWTSILYQNLKSFWIKLWEEIWYVLRDCKVDKKNPSGKGLIFIGTTRFLLFTISTKNAH